MARRKVTPPEKQTKEEKEKILSKADPAAKRFRVTMANGRLKWRKLEEILDSDFLHSDEHGVPSVMLTEPGRKRGSSPSRKRASKKTSSTTRSRKAAVGQDALLKVAKASPESPEVLNQVMLGLIEEAASMESERKRLEADGKSTASVSRNRVAALKAVGDTWLKRQDQNAGNMIDLEGPNFRVLFQFITETFRDALRDAGLRGDQIDTVLARLSKRMQEDWAAEARRRMKNG